MKIHLVHLIALTIVASLHADDVVDNLANANSSEIHLQSGGFLNAAQSFVTGPEFGTLTSVTVALGHNPPGTGPTGTSRARIFLRRSDGDVPESFTDDIVEIVGDVPSFDTDENFTVLSTTNSLLLPNTRYWIDVRRQSGDFEWYSTADASVTPASTGNLLEFRATRGATPNFSPSAAGDFQKMKVIIDPLPGITVTNTNGALRKAIAEAEEGATITFHLPPGDRTIVLDGGELVIDKSLVIDASGVPGGVVITGDRTGDGHTIDDSRVFHISGDNTVVLKSLTITGGRAPDANSGDHRGGGIRNLATTTLWNCNVFHNRAGDNASGQGGDGGGIFSTGTMTLHQSTVSHNRAGDGTDGSSGTGGGIAVGSGTMTLWNSTVSNNVAGDSTVAEGGNGGGIFVSGELILRNSTITVNRAGVGADGFNGGNGGGIARAGADSIVFLHNTLVAGNLVGEGGNGGAPGQGPDLEDDFQTTRSGVNLIGDNTLGNGNHSAVFPAPGTPGEANAHCDLVGTFAAPLEALLGDLADNGGPTPTHLPLRGSPAINPPNGETTSPFATDQGGFNRIVGGIVDIGAVEAPDYAAIDARARAAKRARLSRQIRKFTKKLNIAKRKKQKREEKHFKKKVRQLKKQLRRL